MPYITRKLATKAYDEELPQGCTLVDVRDLIDGPHFNPPVKVMAKIMAVLDLIQQGFVVYIQCHSGINRSNAVAAGALAYQMNIPYDEALSKVKEAIPRANPFPEMVQSAKQATEYLQNNLGIGKK